MDYEAKTNSDRNKSDIFSLREVESEHVGLNSQIYSVRGTPSGKRNRLRTTCSSVFPVGCMGTVEQPLEGVPEIESKTAAIHDDEDGLTGKITSTKEVKDAGEFAAKPPSRNDSARNPVTGVGIESTDMAKFIISKKKKGHC